LTQWKALWLELAAVEREIEGLGLPSFGGERSDAEQTRLQIALDRKRRFEGASRVRRDAALID
jgi:hypothetical protein